MPKSNMGSIENKINSNMRVLWKFYQHFYTLIKYVRPGAKFHFLTVSQWWNNHILGPLSKPIIISFFENTTTNIIESLNTLAMYNLQSANWLK